MRMRTRAPQHRLGRVGWFTGFLLLIGLGCLGTFLGLQFLSGTPVGSAPVPLEGNNSAQVEFELEPSMNPVAVFFDYDVESDGNARRLFEGRGILRGPSGVVLHEERVDVTQSRRERRRLSNGLFGASESGKTVFATLDISEAGTHELVLVPEAGSENLVSAGWSVRRNVTPAPIWLMLVGIGVLLLGPLLKRVLG